jgi:hypothetical protein
MSSSAVFFVVLLASVIATCSAKGSNTFKDVKYDILSEQGATLETITQKSDVENIDLPGLNSLKVRSLDRRSVW